MNDQSPLHNVFISLGSNKGDAIGNLKKARELISIHIGKINQVSDIYTTEAWGLQNQADFMNQVISIFSNLQPIKLMKGLLAIEAEMGRKRTRKWGARLIDLDVLFFNDNVIDDKILTVPHPRLHERNFVLIPLMQLAPDLKHPVFQLTVRELLAWCQDDLDVVKITG